MKVPLSWLKQYVDIDLTTEELVKRLTAIGHMQDKRPEAVGTDTVIDLEVRQNRSDCYSILGIAREVAAVTGKSVKSPKSKVNGLPVSSSDKLKLTNTDPSLCYRFKAVRIKLTSPNSKLTTPTWMREHLEAYGIKVISPLVDITNYVMVETGEPMHAFDIRQVTDGHFVIRPARPGEKMTILGDRELSLTPDDLVIADVEKILSFSGLIGGATSGIQDDTTEVILEAATYNQAVIRRSSIRHSVRTEASTRHEKFLDPRLVDIALARALDLLGQIGGYEVIATAETYPLPVSPTFLTLRTSEITRLGGVDVPLEQVQKFLASLEIGSTLDSRLLTLNCEIPLWRTDIVCEADLVEEVLRLYGYEHIPASLPEGPPPSDITSYWFRLNEQIRDVLIKYGYDEVMTEPLVDTEAAGRFTAPGDVQPVKLQNALNADKSMLRFDMIQGLAHALAHQRKFHKSSIKLFELGKIYLATPKAAHPYSEQPMLGIVVSDEASDKVTLYRTAKGIVESVCTELGYPHADEAVQLDLWDTHTAYASVSLERLCPADKKITAKAVDRLYSNVVQILSVDISIAVEKRVTVGDIITSLMPLGYVTRVLVPENPRIAGTQKTILLRLELSTQAPEKAKVIQAVGDILKKTVGAEIR